jgi:aprataxin
MYPKAKRARIEQAKQEAAEGKQTAERNNNAAAASGSRAAAAASPSSAPMESSPAPATTRSPFSPQLALGVPKVNATSPSIFAGAGTTNTSPHSAATALSPPPVTAAAAAAAAASSHSPSSHPPPTLVLPPLSVLDFHFSAEKANPLAHKALADFMQKHSHESEPDMRIVMVVPGTDGVPAPGAPAEVYEYFTSRDMDSRFQIKVGDITDLASMGVRASYMVHPTTWRFVGGEGGRIQKFMPADFSDKLTTKHQEAKIAWSYVTLLDPSCELAKRCPGLHALFTVRPPNMNDARPDSLRGNYLKGCGELNQAYGAVLLAFGKKLKSNQAGSEAATAPAQQTDFPAPSKGPAANTPSPHVPSPALSIGSPSFSPSPPTQLHPHSGLTPASAASPRIAASAGRVSPFPTTAGARSASPAAAASSSSSPYVSSSTFLPPLHTPAYSAPSGLGKAPTSTHFSIALYDYIKHPRPAVLEPWVFWEDADFVAVYDCFPKARRHLLLLPKKDRVESVLRMGVTDLKLLDEMEARGLWLCEALKFNDANGKVVPLRRGFHAVPSLKLLHLHIISQDFDSPSLKKKVHWQSFTTGFFVQPNRLREMILDVVRSSQAAATAANSSFFASASKNAEERAKASDSLEQRLRVGEKHLTADLRCHRVSCGTKCHNIPETLQHLKLCTSKPYPAQAP